jgi:hypothetical protein
MDDDRDLLLVAVFTTLTIMLWVFFELVQTTKTSTVTQPLQKAVAPLSPKIDTTVLDNLEKKQTFE